MINVLSVGNMDIGKIMGIKEIGRVIVERDAVMIDMVLGIFIRFWYNNRRHYSRSRSGSRSRSRSHSRGHGRYRERSRSRDNKYKKRDYSRSRSQEKRYHTMKT